MSELLYYLLPLGKRSIRLLTLLPSPLASCPLECRLHVVALPEETSTESWPEFKALSYAWHDAPSPISSPPDASSQQRGYTIVCNEVQFSVTENLFLALVRLRSATVPLSLWVDAICINQSDTAERNEQVGFMREIFGRSSKVLVWLGELPEMDCSRKYHWNGGHTDPNFTPRRGSLERHPIIPYDGPGHTYELFCLLSRLSQFTDLSHLSVFGSKVTSPYQQHLASNLAAFVQFMVDRAWWKRTWVVQECILAKRIVVHYGPLSCTWGMLSRAATFYVHSRASQDPRDTLYTTMDVLADRVLQIETPRKALHRGSVLSPLQTLRLFHQRDATDPRDKVFGLLGLLQDHFLNPDYGMSVGTVYLQAAVKIIQSTNRLELLASANSSNTPGVPSWCPDWSIPPNHNEYQRLQYLGLYKATKGLPQSGMYLHRTRNAEILETEGILLETVRYVINHIAPDDGLSSQRFQNTHGIWQDGVRRTLGLEGTLHRRGGAKEDPRNIRTDYHWKLEGYAEQFWRALCGDMVYDGGAQQSTDGGTCRRANQDKMSKDFELYRAYMKSNLRNGVSRCGLTVKGVRNFRCEPPSAINWEQNRFRFAVQLMSGGRCMFVTDSRKIGIGPAGIIAGDRIALLPGSSVPIALRAQEPRACHEATVECLTPKLPHTNAQSGRACNEVHECFKVVGDVYLSKVMDGECVLSHWNKMTTIFLE